MENSIIELLSNKRNNNLKALEIAKILGKDKDDVLDTLRILGKEGIVYKNNDKYMLVSNTSLRKGIIKITSKRGIIVVLEDGTELDVVYKDKGKLRNNDTVLVDYGSHRGAAKVVKIIDRKYYDYIAEVVKEGKKYIARCEDKEDVYLNDIYPLGTKLLISGEDNTIKEVLGHKDDTGMLEKEVLALNGFPTSFSDKYLEEVSEKEKVLSEDNIMYEKRNGLKDQRDIVSVTIDGDDTKDIDDAISVEKLENGHYKLGVHIADVSYYVKEGSPLDNEAMERGTSVYLVDRVIPMLPHKLSNGICSLNPDVERLAISCVMEIDSKGKTVDYEIFESVIKSRIQMTYKKVNKILEEDVIPSGYEPYAQKLKLMKELADIIRKAKVERGYLDFDVDEAKILVDENCVPTDVVLRDRGAGENLIEDFMIQANECVATHIFYMNLPFIYRIHEYPKEEKIKGFLSFVQTLGYTVPGNIKDTSPKSMQKLISFLSDKKEFKILSSLLLRNMQKAVYSPQNLGHYGLASKCYTHFTSPIRRYPDTTVHRLLRTYLFNNDMSPETIRHWEEKLIYVADHSSLKERSSVDCEREVEDMKMAEYMEKHIGEEFKGMISSVTNFGMFVELENLIEGLVHITSLKGFYNYDETSQSLLGEKNGDKYTIGDNVLVKVVAASKEEKFIDFEIIKKL